MQLKSSLSYPIRGSLGLQEHNVPRLGKGGSFVSTYNSHPLRADRMEASGGGGGRWQPMFPAAGGEMQGLVKGQQGTQGRKGCPLPLPAPKAYGGSATWVSGAEIPRE